MTDDLTELEGNKPVENQLPCQHCGRINLHPRSGQCRDCMADRRWTRKEVD